MTGRAEIEARLAAAKRDLAAAELHVAPFQKAADEASTKFMTAFYRWTKEGGPSSMPELEASNEATRALHHAQAPLGRAMDAVTAAEQALRHHDLVEQEAQRTATLDERLRRIEAMATAAMAQASAAREEWRTGRPVGDVTVES